MVAIAAAGTSDLQAKTWYTVKGRMRPTMVRRGLAQERTAVAEFPGPVENPRDKDRMILFPRATEALAMRPREAVDMIRVVNTTLVTRMSSSHVRPQRLTYNNKSNLRTQLVATAMSSMILPVLKEVILIPERRRDPAIIDITRDQKWNRLRVHSVALENYGRQAGGMKRMQDKIEVGTDSIKLTWTQK